MGKSIAVRHTKWYYLAYCAGGEIALGATLWLWTAGSATRRDEFGPETPGVPWATLLVTAIVVTAVAGGLIAFTGTISRILRWAVALAGMISAGAMGPLALRLMVRPSPAALLAAVGVLGMCVAMTGLLRAPFIRKPESRAGHSA